MSRNAKENPDEQREPSSEQLRRRSVSMFTLYSSTAIIITGVLIGWLISNSIRREMVEAWGLSTAAQVQGVIISFLPRDEINVPFRGAKYRDLRRDIDRMIAGTDIKEVIIWRSDGMILFSLNRENIGKKPPRGKLLKRAARGRPTFEFSDLEEVHHTELRKKYTNLVEVYYPIRFHGSDKVRGVFEIYLSVASVNEHIRTALISLISGLGVLGILLIVFAQISSRLLTDENDRLSERTRQLRKSEEQFRRIAEILQESLIRPVPDIPGLSTWVGYESAYEAERVGGDFYDIFQLGPGRAAVLIGDVAGKGVEAAGLTETIRSSVRTVANTNQSPSYVLSQVNEILLPQVSPREFATAVLIIVDINEKVVNIAIAGHPPPLILSTTSYFLDMAPGLPLGLHAGDYSETSLVLESSAAIVLYTDGLIEARRGAELFGQKGALQTVSAQKTSEPQLLVESLLRAATDFTRGRLEDDVAIVAIRFL